MFCDKSLKPIHEKNGNRTPLPIVVLVTVGGNVSGSRPDVQYNVYEENGTDYNLVSIKLDRLYFVLWFIICFYMFFVSTLDNVFVWNTFTVCSVNNTYLFIREF